jgi:hypothetical protein
VFVVVNDGRYEPDGSAPASVAGALRCWACGRELAEDSHAVGFDVGAESIDFVFLHPLCVQRFTGALADRAEMALRAEDTRFRLLREEWAARA